MIGPGLRGRERAGRYLRSGAARRTQGAPFAARRRSPQMRVAYAVALLAPAAFLGVVSRAGVGMSAAWLLLGAVGALVVRAPDSGLSVAVWLGLGIMWSAVPEPSWLVLPAAAVAVLGHCATAYLAGAPRDAVVESTLLRRWLGRIGVGFTVTCAVWVLAAAVGGAAIPGSVMLTTAVLAGVAVWALAVKGRDISPGR